MIAAKSNTALQIIGKISGSAPKVGFFENESVAAAMLTLENKGIPDNRDEDYKYCNIDTILRKEFKNIDQRFIDPDEIESYKLDNAVNLVLINGAYSAALSDKDLPAGITVSPFSALGADERKLVASLAKPADDALVALNTAFCSGGIFIRISGNDATGKPVNIIQAGAAESEALLNPRVFIHVKENSKALIIAQQVNKGAGKVFSNSLNEIWVEKGGILDTVFVQDENMNGYSVCTSQVLVETSARYDNTTVTLSGQLVRNNHHVVLNGSGSEAHLYGLFSTRGTQLVDNHTLMDHRVPHCESNELYKGMVNDKSTGVFNGKIYVRKDAQKTNAYQSSKNILLSDDATVYTKPQLEIYADDVKCSHGTSTGKIDPNAMFYLNARGIGKESAKKMLLSSFALEVLAKIRPENLRDKIAAKFENML